MKSTTLVWVVVLGLISVPSVKAADTVQIVVGEPGPGQPGNADNGFPFNPDAFLGIVSLRYQQVYDSSAFGTIPLEIFALSSRVDDILGEAFSSLIPDIQINLSTTPPAPDGLVSTFDQNVGVDDTIVLPRGPLSLISLHTRRIGCVKSRPINKDWSLTGQGRPL